MRRLTALEVALALMLSLSETMRLARQARTDAHLRDVCACMASGQDHKARCDWCAMNALRKSHCVGFAHDHS